MLGGSMGGTVVGDVVLKGATTMWRRFRWL